METKQVNSNTDAEQPSSQREVCIEQIVQSLDTMLKLELQMIQEDQSNVQ